jgi:tetratricopeptide (TPR) repeat protein
VTEHARARSVALALVAITALAFARTLGFGFVYDDLPVIANNPTLGQAGALGRIFSENVWAFAPDLAEPRYYRPLFTAWLHVNHALFGTAPAGWHATTVGLHLAAVAVLFAFVRHYTGSLLIAGLGVGIWAIHPTRAESVAWVCGLTDPSAALVGFGALLLVLKARPDLGKLGGEARPWLLAPAFALFGAALLLKETSIVFCVAPALLAFFGDGDRKLGRRLVDALILSGPWIALALTYLYVRGQVLGAVAPAYSDPSNATVFRTLLLLAGNYTSHLVSPTALSLSYPIELVRRANQPELVEAFVPAALGLTALTAGLVFGRRSRALTILGLGLLTPVLRVSGLQPDMLFQDRYLYLASACWWPALVWGCLKVQDFFRLSRWTTPAAGAAYAVVMVFLLQANLGPWKDNVALWERAVQVHPASGRAWFNLGTEHENAGNLVEAEVAYGRAVEREPDRALFHFRLAYMLAERRQLDGAMHHFGRAVEIRPTDPMMLYEAGRLQRFVGDPGVAERLLGRAIEYADQGAVIGGGITRENLQTELAAAQQARAERDAAVEAAKAAEGDEAAQSTPDGESGAEGPATGEGG